MPSATGSPSWEELEALLRAEKAKVGIPESPDLVNGPTSPLSMLRLFGTTAEPRVVLYRDHAAWCPYCEKIWLQLEEKQIPYKVEKVNMRCYGDKPAAFLKLCPSGLLPALILDGKLITDSAAIASLLETAFPQRPLLPPAGSQERRAADALLKLERTLFSRWMQWLTSGWGDAQNRAAFEQALAEVDSALAQRGGPFFLGSELSLVDVTFAPFLERMAASLLYYKGLRVTGGGAWPHVDKWFAAMAARPAFAAIQSDFYTHAHDLPPQLGGCEFNADGPRHAAAIDGADGAAWRLPLPPLGPTSAPEPSFAGENPPRDRVEAAARLIGNHAAVVRFAARAMGPGGARPVSAPLADPTAPSPESALPPTDAALRAAAHALLTSPEAAAAAYRGGAQLGPAEAEAAGASLEYLRDRVGVPRDMRFPAARQLRAHLNFCIDLCRGAR